MKKRLIVFFRFVIVLLGIVALPVGVIVRWTVERLKSLIPVE